MPPFQIKTILVPVDGSLHARKAALVAAALADRFGARIILIHVLLRTTPVGKLYRLAENQNFPAHVLEQFKHLAPATYDFGLTIPANLINPVASTELLVRIGQHILDTERHTLQGEGIGGVTALIEDGDAGNCILAAAKREDADFIVLGRRGLGAVQGIFTGSVSTRVSHLAEATVVSVT
jgi:nucleotide-binding universal stress UspA family protein